MPFPDILFSIYTQKTKIYPRAFRHLTRLVKVCYLDTKADVKNSHVVKNRYPLGVREWSASISKLTLCPFRQFFYARERILKTAKSFVVCCLIFC